MRFMTFALLSPAVFALSGCLVNTNSLVADVFEARDDVDGFYAASVSATLPSAGTATYEGFSRITSYSPSDPRFADVFIGTADLTATVDAAGADLSGRLSNFTVAENLAYADYVAIISAYSASHTPGQRQAFVDDVAAISEQVDGSITVSASNQMNPGSMLTYFSGTLWNGATTTTIGGAGESAFYGTGQEYISTYGDTAGALTVTKNGVPYRGSVEAVVGR